MVAVDGRRPSACVGMTNFELAQALVRLGAVTASGFDGGGSSTLAFNGSRESTLRCRRRAAGIEFAPAHVLRRHLDDSRAVHLPNGDGVAEKQRKLSYKVVRPSTVTATLGPATSCFTETIAREPGTYPVAFPPAPLGSDAAGRHCPPRAAGGST